MDLFDFARKNDPPVRVEPVPKETRNPVQAPVTVIREKRDRPFIDTDGGPVIPFESDSRYHWWAGGQSVEETLKEIQWQRPPR